MTLEEIRKNIDAIDSQLLPLFAARMDCAREVAAVKKGGGSAGAQRRTRKKRS